MDEFMLFDSESEAQSELDKLGLQAIIGRLDLTYVDGRTESKWAINRVVMEQNSSVSGMRVEWLCNDGNWR